ncbi:hypothetical protein IGI04_001630, partial [Brassica rapa subsp. trilocularis]
MTTGGTNPDTSGEEPALTPPPPPPLLSSEFMSSVIARLAHQEEVQKTINDQLAAIVAALSASTGNSQPLRRYLFNTNPPTPTEGRTTNPVDPTLQLAETLVADALPAAMLQVTKTTVRTASFTSSTKTGRNGTPFIGKPILQVNPPEQQRQPRSPRSIRQQVLPRPHQGLLNPDEDPPAARQRIEVIRAQPESSSDEESDLEEALDPLDLRTLLKRKTASTNDKNLGPSDLRVELNAKRTKHALSPGSSLASTDDDPIVDLRDQLNARINDLRTKLDRKKA